MPARTDVIRWLATAAYEERLGLFVGTGFSMAATNGGAPSFKSLLERIAGQLGLPADLNAPPYLQKSYPQIASQLVAELVKRGRTPAAAQALLRRSIAGLVNLAPAADQRDRFAQALSAAAPSWIITTNYDVVLEALLDRGRTVLPTQTLFPSDTHVPIYHMHGHRYDPASIRVTEEDYVSMLAPLDYQRLRLPLLFLESTTLLLGYALGDINVRAAMEWAQSFTGARGLAPAEPQGRVIQALYTPNPADAPSIGPNGEIILEISDIPALLTEIGAHAAEIRENNEYSLTVARGFLAGADAPNLIGDDATREEFLTLVEHAVGAVPVQDLIAFLDRATAPIWARATAQGGFDFYGEYLSVLLDVLQRLEYREANPNFIAYLARSLDQVGACFSETRQPGTAWAASAQWLKEAPTLNAELLSELESFARTNHLAGLSRLLGCSTLARLRAADG